jgi:hypothetical protein
MALGLMVTTGCGDDDETARSEDDETATTSNDDESFEGPEQPSREKVLRRGRKRGVR